MRPCREERIALLTVGQPSKRDLDSLAGETGKLGASCPVRPRPPVRKPGYRHVFVTVIQKRAARWEKEERGRVRWEGNRVWGGDNVVDEQKKKKESFNMRRLRNNRVAVKDEGGYKTLAQERGGGGNPVAMAGGTSIVGKKSGEIEKKGRVLSSSVSQVNGKSLLLKYPPNRAKAVRRCKLGPN